MVLINHDEQQKICMTAGNTLAPKLKAKAERELCEKSCNNFILPVK